MLWEVRGRDFIRGGLVDVNVRWYGGGVVMVFC